MDAVITNFYLDFDNRPAALTEFAERLAVGRKWDRQVVAFLQDLAIEAYLIAPAGAPRSAHLLCSNGRFSAPDILVFRSAKPRCWIDVKMRSNWFSCQDDDEDGNWDQYFSENARIIESYFSIAFATKVRFMPFLCIPAENGHFKLYVHVLNDLAEWRLIDGRYLLSYRHFTPIKASTVNPRLRYLREADQTPLTDFERFTLGRKCHSFMEPTLHSTQIWLRAREAGISREALLGIGSRLRQTRRSSRNLVERVPA